MWPPTRSATSQTLKDKLSQLGLDAKAVAESSVR
jgi:hypothetical protein